MSNLPRGPSALGVLDFIRASFFSPAPILQRYAATYGDPFRLAKSPNGPITITGNPEAVRAIYTADPDSFDVFAKVVAEPVFGTTSLVQASGARHKRDRKLISPPFNASAMRAYGAAIAEAANDAAANWSPGRPFLMLETTQAIALDIIVRVVFGIEGRARVRATREAVLGLIESLNPLVFLFTSLRRDFGGIGPWARYRRAVTALDALLAEEIRGRRATCEARQDILSLMIRARYDDGTAMSESELIEQLRTLLFAGHETTAVALASTLYWLHREPAVLARLLDEIDGVGPDAGPDALASLPYLEAVCQEGLRIHPPVVDVGRVTKRPFKLLGYTIPAGEAVSPSPLLLHARGDLYPEPGRFRPERFLERTFSPFEYIPFGGGARRCLGAAFAMYEMKIALGTLLRTHRLRLASDAPIEHVRRGLTMGPRGGVPMILEGTRAPDGSRRPEQPARSAA